MAGETTVTPKPGYKTTEFWFSLAAALVGLVLASGIVPSDGPWAKLVGLVVTGLSAMGYSVGRGLTKVGSAAQIVLLGLMLSLLAGCATWNQQSDAQRIDEVKLAYSTAVNGVSAVRAAGAISDAAYVAIWKVEQAADAAITRADAALSAGNSLGVADALAEANDLVGRIRNWRSVPATRPGGGG